MKIKWDYLCTTCLAPLDPYYRNATSRELQLFDEYLHETALPFDNNNTYFLDDIRVCKCCYDAGKIKYNPKIDAFRQIGIKKFTRPKTNAITRYDMKQWRKDFYEIIGK
jgi:hypothetical protein